MSGVEVHVRLAFADIEVDVCAEGIGGYSTDVMDDICKRAVRSFNEALSYLRAHGMVAIEIDEEDDADDTPD